MLKSVGSFETPNASKYLQQLCKHFAHKIEVDYNETYGECAFPTGAATLRADQDRLLATVTAETEEMLTRAKFIVDKHLQRFAFREEFEQMQWQATDAPA